MLIQYKNLNHGLQIRAVGGSFLDINLYICRFLQQINNSRHTVVYNTRNTLRELLQKGLHLRHRTRYQKAQNVLNTLNKRGSSKGSKRRRTRKA
jgi:hypothetical protein